MSLVAQCTEYKMNVISWLKSKTFWGVIIAILGVLSDPTILAFFPANVGHIITVIGAALAALGLRSAIATGSSVAGVPTDPVVAASKGMSQYTPDIPK